MSICRDIKNFTYNDESEIDVVIALYSISKLRTSLNSKVSKTKLLNVVKLIALSKLTLKVINYDNGFKEVVKKIVAKHTKFISVKERRILETFCMRSEEHTSELQSRQY